MENETTYPQHHPNLVLEKISEQFFTNLIPPAWIIDKPQDFGIDLIISPVLNGNVVGLNFSVQLKSKHDVAEKLEVRLKKTTLNYLFTRLEPVMVVLYDDATKLGYWKWLLPADFDLSLDVASYAVKFDEKQGLAAINWDDICKDVQRVFKVKSRLLTSLEYDLFNTASEAEAKAWSHYFGKNFAEAAFYFKRLVQQEEINTVWWVALAQCQYEEYDYRNALININKAIEFDIADNILLTKGCILTEDGIRNKDKRKLIEAEKLFAKLFERDPSDTHAYNYANALSQLNKSKEAISMYQHALQRNPNYAEAWKNLGQVYYDLGEHALEMECYDKALRINPALLQARICRAITDGRVYEHYESAVATIQECMATSDLIATEFATAYYYLGLFLYRLGKTTEALAWTTKGLDNHPGNGWLRSLKARILHEAVTGGGKEWVDEAIAFFADNYQANGDDGVNFFYLCSALVANGNAVKAKEMALSWLNEKVFSNPTSPLTATELDVEQLMKIVKNQEVVERYLVSNPIGKIGMELDYADIRDGEHLLGTFDVKRILFLTQIADRLEIAKAEEPDKIAELFRTTFLTIDPPIVVRLIRTIKGDTEDFAVEVANVVSTLSTLCIREAVRCVGYAVGYLGLEKVQEPGRNPITGALLAEAMCYFGDAIEQL